MNSLFSFFYLLSVVINSFLGVLVFVKDPKRKLNQVFVAFISGVVVWIISLYYLFHIHNDPWLLLQIGRLNFFVASFLIFFLFLLAYYFPRVLYKWKPIYLYLLFAETVFLGVITQFTDFIDKNETFKDGVLITEYGDLYWWFVIHFLSFLIGSLYLLFRKYHLSQGFEKQQLKLLFYGILVTMLFAVTTNLFIPLLTGYYESQNLGPLGTVFMVGAISYAILKYRFLDIRLIIARSVSYLLLFLFLSITYVGGTLLILTIISGGEASSFNIGIQTALSLFVAFSFHPLRIRFERITDKVFFQSLPDENVFLHDVGDIVSKTLQIELLAKSVVDKIVRDFRLEKCVFLTLNSSMNHIYSVGETEKLDFVLLERNLKKLKNRLTIVNEIKSLQFKNYLREQLFSIILKFTNKDGEIGYLLIGEKKSGTNFYGQEIRLLDLIVPSIAVSLNNTLQYEEIQNFSETLKEKVKEATSKLRVVNRKLIELDERKDEFLNVAAHELRAPLTAVKGYLSMIMEGDVGEISKEQLPFLQGAYTGAEREVRLVNNMLNMSRIEENRVVFKLGRVHLKDVIDQAYMEFKLDAKKKELSLNVEVEDGLKDLVKVDEDRIHEVVSNFVSNAVKYTDDGGVTVRMFNVRRDGKTWVRVEVRDTGPGLSPEEQKKLFGKFYRAESSAGKVLGTGLGLYITKLLIEKFGGDLGLTSEKGNGSMFWFELKVVKGA